MATATAPATFAAELLSALKAPASKANVGLIEGWIAAEGTTAKNNPLATTQREPGSTAFNSKGVQNYATAAEGVAATVQTLHSDPAYKPILGALADSNPANALFGDPSGFYEWVTGSTKPSDAGRTYVKNIAANEGGSGGGLIGAITSTPGSVASTLTGGNGVGSLIGDPISGVENWITKEASLGLAYIVLTVLGIALVFFGLLDLFGYSPRRVAGAITPTPAAAAADIPF